MTICTSIDTLAMAYLDDELADEELRDFEMHLRECAACRGRVDGEREAIAALRRRLATPPAPDVLRARLSAALDAEDAGAARAERRRRAAAWILPGAASLAAVAALALFVLLPSAPASEPVTAEVVRQQMRRPEIPIRVVANGQTDFTPVVDRVATWEGTIRNRRIVHRAYVALTSTGAEPVIQVSMFDARGLNLDIGQPVPAGDKLLYFVSVPEYGWAISHRSRDGVGFVFRSDDLTPDQLVELIRRFDLVERARTDEPRK